MTKEVIKILKEIYRYSGFVSNAMKEVFAYKFRALIQVVSTILFMFIQYYLWKIVFLSNGGEIQGISSEQYISYIAMGLVINQLTVCYQDFYIGDEVKDGNIAMSLLKPFSFRRMIFARHVGDLTGGLIQLIPAIIAASLISKVKIGSAIIFVKFCISIALAQGIVFLFVYGMGIVTFWITNQWGLYILREHIRKIFSGEIIALGLLLKISNDMNINLPFSFISAEAVQGIFKTIAYISYCLPFQAMYYTPTAIYTGMIKAENINVYILIQLFWLIVMYFFTTFMWKKATKKISILGG